MRRSTIAKLRLRTDQDFSVWLWLVLGTLAILGIAALLILSLLKGAVALSVVGALILLYNIWNTYDTFVVKECWTLYLKEVE